MDPLKVALASDWFYPKVGGIETHIHELALNLLERGVQPFVLTHDYRFYPGSWSDRFPYPVFRIRGSLYFRSHHVSVGPSTAHAINELLKRLKPDLTHVHSIYSIFSLIAANVSRGIRGLGVVATNHSLFDWQNSAAVRALPLLRYALKRVDVVIAVSSVVARDTRRVLGPKLAGRIPVCVVPNAINTRFWRPPEPEEARKARRMLGLGESEFVILSLGRFTPRKRLHAAIKIAALASRKAPKRLSLVLVGDGDLRGVIDRAVERFSRLVPTLRIVRYGFVERSRLRMFYWASDAVVIPGRMEAMPITALEALACERPVLGFRGTGLEDVIVDGVNGFLVGSDEEAAEKLGILVGDDDLRAKLSHGAAYIAGRKFDWSRVIRDIIALYRLAAELASWEDKRYPVYKLWLSISSMLRRRQ